MNGIRRYFVLLLYLLQYSTWHWNGAIFFFFIKICLVWVDANATSPQTRFHPAETRCCCVLCAQKSCYLKVYYCDSSAQRQSRYVSIRLAAFLSINKGRETPVYNYARVKWLTDDAGVNGGGHIRSGRVSTRTKTKPHECLRGANASSFSSGTLMDQAIWC